MFIVQKNNEFTISTNTVVRSHTNMAILRNISSLCKVPVFLKSEGIRRQYIRGITVEKTNLNLIKHGNTSSNLYSTVCLRNSYLSCAINHTAVISAISLIKRNYSKKTGKANATSGLKQLGRTPTHTNQGNTLRNAAPNFAPLSKGAGERRDQIKINKIKKIYFHPSETFSSTSTSEQGVNHRDRRGKKIVNSATSVNPYN